ncbi:MAG: bifunctional oligoribonuclease/PAP phosphatase NrnA [Alphaproteobacteria bacterium]|nr:bifunctional oligoribonuclease/PAP phosphatase NrnA [Alphaproteobacteria bacterium]
MTTPREMLEALVRSGRVLLTGPSQPDGDSIGACLALQRVLRARGVTCEVAGEPSYRYTWMPGVDGMVPDARIEADWPAVVVLDGDRHRLSPRTEAAFTAAPLRGIIDHHASTTNDGYTHFWLAPEAGSACEMLYAQLGAWDVPLDRALAEVLYTGLIFDTGCFRYSNTTPESHAMAARLLEAGIDHAAICLQVLMDKRQSGLRLASEVFAEARFELDGQLAVSTVTLGQRTRLDVADGDLEGLVESLSHVHGVEVGVLLIERADGWCKLSLRSRGKVNVASVAKSLSPSGGGHAKAAGVSLREPLADIRARVISIVGDALS